MSRVSAISCFLHGCTPHASLLSTCSVRFTPFVAVASCPHAAQDSAPRVWRMWIAKDGITSLICSRKRLMLSGSGAANSAKPEPYAFSASNSLSFIAIISSLAILSCSGLWLYGMRFTERLIAGSSYKGRRKSASSMAWRGLSLTPAIITTATMKRGSGLPPPVLSKSMKASLNSIIGNPDVGTSWLRKESCAECTDQTTWHRMPFNARIWDGEGATVEICSRFRAKPIRCKSPKASTASFTFFKLAKGSPIPIKTTFKTFGKPSSLAIRLPCTTWAIISSACRFRKRPMRPVRQNWHAWAQTTCELIQIVVALVKAVLDVLVVAAGGIRTDSTERPS